MVTSYIINSATTIAYVSPIHTFTGTITGIDTVAADESLANLLNYVKASISSVVLDEYTDGVYSRQVSVDPANVIVTQMLSGGEAVTLWPNSYEGSPDLSWSAMSSKTVLSYASAYQFTKGTYRFVYNGFNISMPGYGQFNVYVDGQFKNVTVTTATGIVFNMAYSYEGTIEFDQSVTGDTITYYLGAAIPGKDFVTRYVNDTVQYTIVDLTDQSTSTSLYDALTVTNYPPSTTGSDGVEVTYTVGSTTVTKTVIVLDPDTTGPTITLTPDTDPIVVHKGDSIPANNFVASVYDTLADGSTAAMNISDVSFETTAPTSGNVFTTAGTYQGTWTASDSASPPNTTIITRSISVIGDTTAPTIVLVAQDPIIVYKGDSVPTDKFVVSVSDVTIDGSTVAMNISDVSFSTTAPTTGDVFTTAGTYQGTWTATDAASPSNTTIITRSIVVVGDITAPTITLTSGAGSIEVYEQSLVPADRFIVSVTDTLANGIVVQLQASDVEFTTNAPITDGRFTQRGTWSATWRISDNAEPQNEATVTRSIIVHPDTSVPVITLSSGSGPVVVMNNSLLGGRNFVASATDTLADGSVVEIPKADVVFNGAGVVGGRFQTEGIYNGSWTVSDGAYIPNTKVLERKVIVLDSSWDV